MILFKYYIDIPENFTGVCTVTSINVIYHYKDGKIHNESGPAIISKDGTKIWCINGYEHREDGPAVEFASGDKRWHYKNKRYGYDNDFTIKTWIEKVEYLKREEGLKIFK